MPNCKLIWGSSSSHTLTLEVGRRGLQTTYRQEREMNMSGSGKSEYINLYGIQEMEIDFYITTDKYRDAVAWWSWVRQGKPFGFATSASDMGGTTITSAISASTTSISVASASSFAAADTVIIRSASSDDTFELAKISSISSATVTITAGTKYAYSAGAIFRHYNYWGSCVILDTSFAPQQTDAGFYTHRIRFQENL